MPPFLFGGFVDRKEFLEKQIDKAVELREKLRQKLREVENTEEGVEQSLEFRIGISNYSHAIHELKIELFGLNRPELNI